uniref:Gnk2-homologous domain-containing protein n=1 Tax=Araucaria cunninghamii TaxID=56994 RepID=A0A0D6R613_ARACU
MRGLKGYLDNLRPMASKPYSKIFLLFFYFIFSNLLTGLTQVDGSYKWPTGPVSSGPFPVWTSEIQYATGSIFQKNLNKVLNDLVVNTSATAFNTSSYGQSPNKVYALLQCQGDASQQECSSCLQKAIRYTAGTVDGDIIWCDRSVGCQLWFERCFLRYDNYSFFSIFDEDDFSSMALGLHRNSTNFETTLLRLLSNLSAEALEPAKKGFAAGSTNYSASSSSSPSEKIEGVMQCSGDLSIANCSACLSNLTQWVVNNKYSKNLQAKYVNRSCFIFYNSTESGDLPLDNLSIKKAPIMSVVYGVLLMEIALLVFIDG